MKRIASVLGVLFLCACGSGSGDTAPVVNPPAAPSVAAEPSADRRVEELQVMLAEVLERMDVMNARMQKLEAGVPPQTPVTSSRAAAPTGAAASAPTPASNEAAEAPANEAVTSPLQGAAIAEDYRHALMLFGKSNMAEARRTLDKVYQADPGGELADNALYWIGETYYSTGNYTEAVKFYQRVSAEYPNENKAPDALLKIGLVYVKKGDLLLARSTLQQLVDRYPYSTPAATARGELKRIKY